MRNGVEVRLEIRINDIAIVGSQQRLHPAQCILGAATRTKTIAVRGKRHVEDRFEDQTQGGLHDAVPHGRNPERAPLARAFGNPMPSNRLGRYVPSRSAADNVVRFASSRASYIATVTWSTPAAPRFAFTRAKAARSVASAQTLSITVYQRPPLTPCSSAVSIRSVHTSGAVHAQRARTAPTGLAPAGTVVGWDAW